MKHENVRQLTIRCWFCGGYEVCRGCWCTVCNSIVHQSSSRWFRTYRQRCAIHDTSSRRCRDTGAAAGCWPLVLVTIIAIFQRQAVTHRTIMVKFLYISDDVICVNSGTADGEEWMVKTKGLTAEARGLSVAAVCRGPYLITSLPDNFQFCTNHVTGRGNPNPFVLTYLRTSRGFATMRWRVKGLR